MNQSINHSIDLIHSCVFRPVKGAAPMLDTDNNSDQLKAAIKNAKGANAVQTAIKGNPL